MIQTIKLGTLRWHYIQEPSDENLDFLLENFHFHPLDIEDCRSVNQRPKIDSYDDYYFLILHFPSYDRWKRMLKTREVKIFWGEEFLVTIGKPHWVLSSLFETALNHTNPSEILEAGTSDALLYRILEKLMQESLSLVSKMGTEVELINRELFDKKAEKTIERISLTRRNIILLNTIFKPQLKLFLKLESGQVKGFAQSMEEYWGNILDYYQKIWDMVEDYQELVEGLSKTFDSLQTNRTNQIMRVLTLISSVLLPMTLIASVFGIYMEFPAGKSHILFWILMGAMMALSGSLIILFRRKHWM